MPRMPVTPTKPGGAGADDDGSVFDSMKKVTDRRAVSKQWLPTWLLLWRALAIILASFRLLLPPSATSRCHHTTSPLISVQVFRLALGHHCLLSHPVFALRLVSLSFCSLSSALSSHFSSCCFSNSLVKLLLEPEIWVRHFTFLYVRSASCLCDPLVVTCYNLQVSSYKSTITS